MQSAVIRGKTNVSELVVQLCLQFAKKELIALPLKFRSIHTYKCAVLQLEQQL